jgi:hypothetical protein
MNIYFAKDNAVITVLVSDYFYVTTPFKGKSTYVCDKNKISIHIKWHYDTAWFFGPYADWSGSFDENTIIFTDVFGKTVRFIKQ